LRWATVAKIAMRRKEGGCCATFAERMGLRLTQCALVRGLLPDQVASSSIQPFGHNRHEPKTGGCAPFRRSWVPIEHNVAWTEAYRRTKRHLDPSSRLATIDMVRTMGEAGLFLGGGAGSPSNTKSPGTRPTSIPSGISVHPALWPQRTWTEN